MFKDSRRPIMKNPVGQTSLNGQVVRSSVFFHVPALPFNAFHTDSDPHGTVACWASTASSRTGRMIIHDDPWMMSPDITQHPKQERTTLGLAGAHRLESTSGGLGGSVLVGLLFGWLPVGYVRDCMSLMVADMTAYNS